MAKKNDPFEQRMQERPEGVTERQWRAKLVYEDETRAEPDDEVTRTSRAAKDAADAVLRGEHPDQDKTAA